MRRSAMLMSAMIFSREMTPPAICLGERIDLVQHAVDAVADPQVVLGRLDVDVGRAVLDRLGDQQVDEPDDRGVLDRPRSAGQVVLVVALVVRHRGGEVVQLAVGAAEPVDRAQQVVAGRDDGPRRPCRVI